MRCKFSVTVAAAPFFLFRYFIGFRHFTELNAGCDFNFYLVRVWFVKHKKDFVGRLENY